MARAAFDAATTQLPDAGDPALLLAFFFSRDISPVQQSWDSLFFSSRASPPLLSRCHDGLASCNGHLACRFTRRPTQREHHVLLEILDG